MTKSYGRIYQNKSNVSITPFDIYNLYPVGSIYMSVNSTNPSNYFGGTWERISGRFLLGAIDDNIKYSPGMKGGEEYHTLTVDEMPSHSHALQVWNKNDSGSLSRWGINDLVWYNNILGEGKTNYWVGGTTYVGGSQGHYNIPPYLAVYIWKRVA
ncbi:MAG: phage baseplate protein [Candidatus Coprovivens sp.]